MIRFLSPDVTRDPKIAATIPCITPAGEADAARTSGTSSDRTDLLGINNERFSLRVSQQVRINRIPRNDGRNSAFLLLTSHSLNARK